MRILVAGSNKNGNDKFKDEAIAIFETAGLLAQSTRHIFRSDKDPVVANQKIDKALFDCDIFYVVCSNQGYIGHNTIFRLGQAEGLGGKIICSSHAIANKDLQPSLPSLIDSILTPQALVQRVMRLSAEVARGVN